MPEEVIVHNVWTLYSLNRDGSEAETRCLEAARPQDWGDPRWHYEHYEFVTTYEGTRFVNHCHCWDEIPRKHAEYATQFAQVIVMIMLPGTPEWQCKPGLLRADDFWQEAWGPLPAYGDEEPDELEAEVFLSTTPP